MFKSNVRQTSCPQTGVATAWVTCAVHAVCEQLVIPLRGNWPVRLPVSTVAAMFHYCSVAHRPNHHRAGSWEFLAALCHVVCAARQIDEYLYRYMFDGRSTINASRFQPIYRKTRWSFIVVQIPAVLCVGITLWVSSAKHHVRIHKLLKRRTDFLYYAKRAACRCDHQLSTN